MFIEISYDNGLILVCVIALGVIIYQLNRRIGLFKFLKDQPIKYSVPGSNQDNFKEALTILQTLNITEREILIQQIFGRPIRILKGLDKNGESWLESVSYFESNGDEDFNFHYEQSKDNKHIG